VNTAFSDVTFTFFELNRSINYKWAVFWVVPLFERCGDCDELVGTGACRLHRVVLDERK